MRVVLFSIVSVLATMGTALAASSFDGSIELEQRLFFERKKPFADTNRGQTSIRLTAEYAVDWNDGDDLLLIEPLVRIDSDDDERSHGDLRQFLYTHRGQSYEFSAGLGRVFWGVTESQHLVDIINQTDGVENIDFEDKLGQPMLRYTYYSDFGTLDAFVLPYFRTRTFAGFESRLNGGLVVDNDNALFESSAEESHTDVALRYAHTIGDWGIGLSAFSGTSRDPDLFRFADLATGTSTPYYAQIDQFGADIQLTTDAWLFKIEAIQRNFDDRLYMDFTAATVGAEYTLGGIFGSSFDLGLLGEYSWDERQRQSDLLLQDDVFVGARLALNDISDSQFLFGVTEDLDYKDSRTLFVEGATRLAPTVTLNVELRYFDSKSTDDLLFRFRDDSFIQIGLEYFFD